jgi:glucosamine--fructose-6-phosphate aminotransferase (isomerizing)
MTKAGPEISVAATKTYTAQLVSLYLIALKLALNRGAIDEMGLRELKAQLRSLPTLIERVLDRADSLQDAVEVMSRAQHAFFIGRNINFPSMLEGALKLKEISYIHAEGYAAGELKHGPLALLDPDTPLVAACLRDHTYEKMISNVTEVAARGSPVLIVASDGDEQVHLLTDHVIFVPRCPPLLSPVPLAVLLQLLAYHVAKAKGMPIDKPRNLAKSVTVE